jgi:hypothetical protein
MILLLITLVTSEPNYADFSCTTDLDCECKLVPYEAPNNSAVCIEYRKGETQ